MTQTLDKADAAKLVKAINKAKGQTSLAEAQALVAATLAITPFCTRKSQADKIWDDRLRGKDLQADESRVLYGKAGKKFKAEGFYVPPPFLFQEDAALQFVKRMVKGNLHLDLDYSGAEETWTVTTKSGGTGTHAYCATAIVLAVLNR